MAVEGWIQSHQVNSVYTEKKGWQGKGTVSAIMWGSNGHGRAYRNLQRICCWKSELVGNCGWWRLSNTNCHSFISSLTLGEQLLRVSELCPMYFNDGEIKISYLYFYGAESILPGKWITISLIPQWEVLWDKHTQEDDVVQRKCSQLPLGRASLIAPVGKESTCNAGDPGLIPGPGRSTGEGISYPVQYSWASLVAQLAKNPPAVWETWVQSLGWDDPLEKGKATHSSILVCRIP